MNVPLPPERDRDELVSAVLDGQATLDERALVESDPALARRLDQMRQVRSLLEAAPLDVAWTESSLASALEAFDLALLSPLDSSGSVATTAAGPSITTPSTTTPSSRAASSGAASSGASSSGAASSGAASADQGNSSPVGPEPTRVVPMRRPGRQRILLGVAAAAVVALAWAGLGRNVRSTRDDAAVGRRSAVPSAPAPAAAAASGTPAAPQLTVGDAASDAGATTIEHGGAIAATTAAASAGGAAPKEITAAVSADLPSTSMPAPISSTFAATTAAAPASVVVTTDEQLRAWANGRTVAESGSCNGPPGTDLLGQVEYQGTLAEVFHGPSQLFVVAVADCHAIAEVAD